MKSLQIAVILTLVAILPSTVTAQPQPAEEKKKDPNRERIGLRAGYVTTPSNLNNSFGAGLDLSLHWVQRIKYPLAVDFTLGAFYLGSTGREDITIDIFRQPFDNVSMRVLHITVAPTLELAIRERTHLFVSVGGGLYTVSLLLDQAFSEGETSNNHFGVVGSAGIIRQISGNWFVDASFQAHKFWTGTSFYDMFYRYSEGDGNPVFYDVALGFMLRLF